jgi:hypothetical protein
MTPSLQSAPTRPRSGTGPVAVLACAALLASSAPLPAQMSVQQPEFSSSLAGEDIPVSTDGTLNLSWHVGERGPSSDDAATGISYELEETPVGGERVLIDAGAHLAAALSGRDNGLYRYRVRAVSHDGPASVWSEPIEVRVEHHPLWLAFVLFAIGAAVFVATASLVLLGHRRSKLARS